MMTSDAVTRPERPRRRAAADFSRLHAVRGPSGGFTCDEAMPPSRAVHTLIGMCCLPSIGAGSSACKGTWPTFGRWVIALGDLSPRKCDDSSERRPRLNEADLVRRRYRNRSRSVAAPGLPLRASRRGRSGRQDPSR